VVLSKLSRAVISVCFALYSLDKLITFLDCAPSIIAVRFSSDIFSLASLNLLTATVSPIYLEFFITIYSFNNRFYSSNSYFFSTCALTSSYAYSRIEISNCNNYFYDAETYLALFATFSFTAANDFDNCNYSFKEAEINPASAISLVILKNDCDNLSASFADKPNISRKP